MNTPPCSRCETRRLSLRSDVDPICAPRTVKAIATNGIARLAESAATLRADSLVVNETMIKGVGKTSSSCGDGHSRALLLYRSSYLDSDPRARARSPGGITAHQSLQMWYSRSTSAGCRADESRSRAPRPGAKLFSGRFVPFPAAGPGSDRARQSANERGAILRGICRPHVLSTGRRPPSGSSAETALDGVATGVDLIRDRVESSRCATEEPTECRRSGETRAWLRRSGREQRQGGRGRHPPQPHVGWPALRCR